MTITTNKLISLAIQQSDWQAGRSTAPEPVDRINYRILTNCKILVQSYGFYFADLPNGYRAVINNCSLEIDALAGKMSIRIIFPSKDWITFEGNYQGEGIGLHGCYLEDTTPVQVFRYIENICKGLNNKCKVFVIPLALSGQEGYIERVVNEDK